MWRDTSTTMPEPTTCPASEVPAVLGMIPTEYLLASLIKSSMSAVRFWKRNGQRHFLIDRCIG